MHAFFTATGDRIGAACTWSKTNVKILFFYLNFGIVFLNMNGIRTNIEMCNFRLWSYSINYYPYHKLCDIHNLVLAIFI